MAHLEMSGFDDLIRDFRKMADNVKRASEGASIEELFTTGFMQAHSKFSSISEFFTAGGFAVISWDDVEPIPDDALDAHVTSFTDFPTWSAMLEAASSELIDGLL